MSHRDPVELFRSLQPVADRGVGERSDDEILAEVLATPIAGRRRRWSIRWWPFGVGAVAVASASFVLMQSEPVTNPLAVACLGSVDTNPDIWALPAAENPVAACEELWASGEIGDGTVPELTACVNEAGIAAVIPAGQDGCAELGLPVLESGFTDEQRAVVELQDRLVAEFNSACFGQEEAPAEAERVLADIGLEGWSVIIAEDFPPGRDCAGTGVDAIAEQVILYGVPPP